MAKKRLTRGINQSMNFWQSSEMNDVQFNFYFKQLMNMACSIYRWENLPPEIDERFMQLTLISKGLVTFFYDEEYGKFFATEAAPYGGVNMYRNPLGYRAYGAGGFNRELKADDCVPIWNNYLRTEDISDLTIYARRLADIDRTVDVNLAVQKMPIFVTCPESQRLTVQNLVKQWLGNEPVIIGADGILDVDKIGYVSSGAPFIVNDLFNAKLTVWSEVMTFLGIDNQNIQKAERVQSAEVEANEGQIEANRLSRLNIYRKACEQINDKYGLDVWVDFNEDIETKLYRQQILGYNDEEEDGEEIAELS